MAGDVPASSEKISRIGPCQIEENNSNECNEEEDIVSTRNPGVDFDEIRRAMCHMVIDSEISFHTSSKFGFREFASSLCPQVILPNADDLRSDALNYYNKERKIVEDELQRAPGGIYITVDNLRDAYQSSEYLMCVNAHWIDCDWKLQRRMIRLEYWMHPFDSECFSDEIISCLDKWKISDKVFGFTIDNPSVSLGMMPLLKDHFQAKNSLVFGGKFFHIRCAHKIITLAVLSCLKLVGGALDKIRSIVGHIRAFDSKKKEFYDSANSCFGLDTSKRRLINDTIARWDSTYVMLDRVFYFRDVIDSFVGKDEEMKELALSLAQQEWGEVAEIFNFLKFFYDLINTYIATKTTPTADVYFHVMWRILVKLSDILKGGSSFLTAMAKEMQKKCDKYWSDHCCILSCAAVFDPRYKLDRVEFCYEKLCGEKYAKEMIGKVKTTLHELFNEYKKVVGKPNIVIRGDMEIDDYEEYVAFLSKKKRKVEEKSELERYLEDWRTDFGKDSDILGYWKNNSERFPVLSCLARDILGIPMSTVGMKSRFSTVKNFRCIWRRTLPIERVEPFVCYQDWLRAKGLSKGSPFYGYDDEDIEDGSDWEREGEDEGEGEDTSEDEDEDEDGNDESDNEDEDA